MVDDEEGERYERHQDSLFMHMEGKEKVRKGTETLTQDKDFDPLILFGAKRIETHHQHHNHRCQRQYRRDHAFEVLR